MGRAVRPVVAKVVAQEEQRPGPGGVHRHVEEADARAERVSRERERAPGLPDQRVADGERQVGQRVAAIVVTVAADAHARDRLDRERDHQDRDRERRDSGRAVGEREEPRPHAASIPCRDG